MAKMRASNPSGATQLKAILDRLLLVRRRHLNTAALYTIIMHIYIVYNQPAPSSGVFLVTNWAKVYLDTCPLSVCICQMNIHTGVYSIPQC